MGDGTEIQWTDATWNPVRGCTRVSEGCRHCYAEGVAARFSGRDPAGKPLPYFGLARQSDHGPRWTGKVVMVPEHLDDPIRWKRPRRIFVNSMSDLFHEKLTDDQIESVFRVMLNAPRHTYQILTKRAKRMHWWINRFEQDRGAPLPNFIHLGISAEDQENFDARAPYLRRVNAAVRFVSYEPALGPLNLEGYLPEISWVIIGGESGRDPRAFDVEWARSAVRQCRAAGAAPFVKQLGGKPFDSTGRWSPTGPYPMHGPDIIDWGNDFAIREFPKEAA